MKNHLSKLLLVIASITIGSSALAIESALILGASASNNFAAPSPGLLIGQHAGLTENNILVIAEDGVKSKRHDVFIRFLLPQMKIDHVFAVDLFFHDFKNEVNPSEEDLNRMERYVDALANNARSVYIGSAIDWVRLGGATKANVVLKALTERYDNVHYLDMNGLFAAIHSDEGYHYQINGKDFVVFKKDVMADRIHPNLLGSTLLANHLIQMMRSSPDGRHQNFPYLEIEAPTQTK